VVGEAFGGVRAAFRVPVAITVYDKFQVPKREEEKRERVDGHRDLRVRYPRFQSEQMLRRFDSASARLRLLPIRDEARRRRAELRLTVDRMRRKSSHSVIAFERRSTSREGAIG
jgi:hypothetical protein